MLVNVPQFVADILGLGYVFEIVEHIVDVMVDEVGNLTVNHHLITGLNAPKNFFELWFAQKVQVFQHLYFDLIPLPRNLNG